MRKGEGRGNGVRREEWKVVEWSGGDEEGIEGYEKEPQEKIVGGRGSGTGRKGVGDKVKQKKKKQDGVGRRGGKKEYDKIEEEIRTGIARERNRKEEQEEVKRRKGDGVGKYRKEE